MYRCLKVILKRQQKADLVIKLAKEGKNTRDIAKVVHASLKTVCICKHIKKNMENNSTDNYDIHDIHDEKNKEIKTNCIFN